MINKYMYMHTHTHTLAYTHIHIYIYIYVRMYVCMYACMYVCMNIHAYHALCMRVPAPNFLTALQAEFTNFLRAGEVRKGVLLFRVLGFWV